MKFSEALKKKRKQLGLTQAQMVAGIDISRFQYSKIENGYRKIYVDDLLKMFKLREIDGKEFWDDYFNIGMNESEKIITKELTQAFYESDLKTLIKLEKEIEKRKDVSLEKKYHALLMINGIQNGTSKITTNKKHEIIKALFQEDNWTQNIDSLRIFGNAMPLFDISTLNTLMKSIIKEYKHLDKNDEETQLRIAEICINYLYNNRTFEINKEIKDTFALLSMLPNRPNFALYKLLFLYFKYTFLKDNQNTELIKQTLKNMGYINITNRL